MYNNNNMHNVLLEMRKFLVENNHKGNFPFDYNKFMAFCKIDAVTFAESMTYLRHEGFITMSNFENGTCTVVLLPKGDYAAVSRFFKRENYKIIWNLIRDIGTFVVAIVTVATLLISVYQFNDIKESLPHIQERIMILEKELSTQQKEIDKYNHLRIYQKDTLKVSLIKR